jgi:hypothetical protein
MYASTWIMTKVTENPKFVKRQAPILTPLEI